VGRVVNLQQLREELKLYSYKPGCVLEAVPGYGDAVVLRVEAKTTCALTGEAVVLRQESAQEDIEHWKKDDVRLAVRALVLRMEEHEVDEWLRYRGVPVVDPHPQRNAQPDGSRAGPAPLEEAPGASGAERGRLPSSHEEPTVKRTMIVAAAGLAALAAALFAACKVSAQAEAGPGVPLFGGASVTVDIDGRRVSPQPDPDGAFPKDGDCIRVHFKDADGKEIGSADVTVGGPGADAPDGTEGVTVSPCDPPAKDKKDKTQAMGWGRIDFRAAGSLVTVPFRSLPFRMEDGRGRWVDYAATAASVDQAEGLARAFEQGTLEKPRPEGVEAYGFADVEVLADGRVRFSIVSWRRPSDVSLVWNGHPLADRVEHAHVTRTRGGWYASTVLVPAGYVNYDAGGLEVANEAAFSVLTADGLVEQRLAVTVTP
jgi:hypothetical protein